MLISALDIVTLAILIYRTCLWDKDNFVDIIVSVTHAKISQEWTGLLNQQALNSAVLKMHEQDCYNRAIQDCWINRLE